MVLLCLSLLIGPLNRIWPVFAPLVAWRRDLGLWFGITASIHVYLLAERRKWDVLGFFFDDEMLLLKATAHASNWVGLVALGLTIFLALTSNAFSKKLLSPSGWKFAQQSVYSVFLLSVLHTFIFVYQVDGRQSEAFRLIFWIGILSVCSFQFLGFLKTVLIRRKTSRV